MGYEIQEAGGRIVGQLELAWPRKKPGVAVSDADVSAAHAHGWTPWTMLEALERL